MRSTRRKSRKRMWRDGVRKRFRRKSRRKGFKRMKGGSNSQSPGDLINKARALGPRPLWVKEDNRFFYNGDAPRHFLAPVPPAPPRNNVDSSPSSAPALA